jgi:RNA polymerase sigma-70 factor (ECF subfamily)
LLNLNETGHPPGSTARRLAAVDRLEHRLAGYHAYHATRADLLRRLGRSQKSRAAYDKAIELAGNTAETAYLTRRRDQLG